MYRSKRKKSFRRGSVGGGLFHWNIRQNSLMGKTKCEVSKGVHRCFQKGFNLNRFIRGKGAHIEARHSRGFQIYIWDLRLPKGPIEREQIAAVGRGRFAEEVLQPQKEGDSLIGKEGGSGGECKGS